MATAFTVIYAMTVNAVFGGLAVIIEPVTNVLLPYPQSAWPQLGCAARTVRGRYLMVAPERLSQPALHAGVAFAVMYFATGSLALGSMLALLEPVCIVILLPFHDRISDSFASRRSMALA
ncbi:DUF2061 domain-containing protein [Massilia sp. BSC265]|uniref:DUF2061 domain-containing protein n=1 Tax=Massilia sp. BSC265 TaxID=1549812 RepID=UPI00190F79E8|nr:DUF2061 domain-containing protein [Massilia sp. BSC265]